MSYSIREQRGNAIESARSVSEGYAAEKNRHHLRGLDRGDGDLSSQLHNPRNNHQHLSAQRKALPIARIRSHLIFALEKYRSLVLVGETGSGKSTQITQYLHEAGWTRPGSHAIVCTQSRRISTIAVATRVAEEMGVVLGREVGYAMRFDSKASKDTVIKYVTDGTLLRETMSDPLLTAYSVVIVDEAHERSLYSDILIGLLKKIQRKRKDLRVIIMSATVDAVAFRDFFETNSSREVAANTASIM